MNSQALTHSDPNDSGQEIINIEYQLPNNTQLVQPLQPIQPRPLNNADLAMSLYPSPEELHSMAVLAEAVVKSGFAPSGVNTTDKALMVLLKGRELGLPMMQAFANISIVANTRLTPSSALMLALAERAGHTWWIEETSATKCVLKGIRANDPEHVITTTYTIAEATKAGLLNKGGNGRGPSPWEAYPEDMLFARCASRHARRLDPAQLGTLFKSGELGAMGNFSEMGQSVANVSDNSRPKPSPAKKDNIATPAPAKNGGTLHNEQPATNNPNTQPKASSNPAEPNRIASSNSTKTATPTPLPTSAHKAAIIDAAIAVGKRADFKNLAVMTKQEFVDEVAMLTHGFSPEGAAAEMGYTSINLAVKAADFDLSKLADGQKLRLAFMLVEEWFKQNRPDLLVAYNGEAVSEYEQDDEDYRDDDDNTESDMPF